MDVREKLVELLKTNACPAPFMCDPACRYYGFGDCFPDRFADYLIAHGVTVQEWIPATERLPENNQWTLCLMKDKSFGTFRVLQWNYIDWEYNDGNERWKEKDVTHWMPLPLPPKGE